MRKRPRPISRLICAAPLWLACGFAVPDARAQSRAATFACAPGLESVPVAGVTEALDLLADDGRVLRLAGIDPHRDPQAQAALSGWLAGASVTLAILSPRPDRWGRTPAVVHGPGASPDAAPVLVAEMLVDAGLARVRPLGEGRACMPALLAAEEAARHAKAGLWADPRHRVLRAADVAELRARAGTFVLVEGRVSRIGEGRQRFYLNFGGGRGTFSVSVFKKNAKAFEADKPLKSLIGRTIRVRGVIEARFGPEIEVSSPDEVEFIESSGKGAKTGASD